MKKMKYYTIGSKKRTRDKDAFNQFKTRTYTTLYYLSLKRLRTAENFITDAKETEQI